MEGSKTLFCYSKFPCARGRISSKLWTTWACNAYGNYRICINNNNAIINNNYGRLQDFILLFKIPMCTRKDFFEVYGQHGQVMRIVIIEYALIIIMQ